MKSMTGYGHGVFKGEDYHLEIEIKSYNSRYLEIVHSMPYILSCYEQELDGLIKERAGRGHVELTVRLKVISSSPELFVDEGALASYVKAYGKISEITSTVPTFSDYASIEGMVQIEKGEDAGRYRDTLFSVMAVALDMFEASKLREGEATRKDLLRLGGIFRDSLEAVKAASVQMPGYFRNLLTTRYEELLHDKGLDDARFMEEVTLLLVKYSINEEIKRLDAHVCEYFKLVSSDEAVGKRLDFLCQEMNRESNTIGSKSQMLEISRCVVDLKDSLENIREQIRNIE